MARAAEPKAVPEADEIPDVPLPRHQSALIGHHEAEQTLLDAYRSERLHHAWILGGPKGIGKSTLAYRFARFAIAHPDRFSSGVAHASDLSVDPSHPVFRQVASGAHPNILHLRRIWNDKKRPPGLTGDIPVDAVRKTVSFFGTTASASSWRFCIVDSADEMNASSANALLKILEEPPVNSLFLVLSHTPGRLLPTIRSRCRQLDLQALTSDEITRGLPVVAPDTPVAPDQMADITRFADGSMRAALTLLSGDGLAINRGFVGLAEAAPNHDIGALHAFADLIAARGATDNWDIFLHIARDWLHQRMKRDVADQPARLVRWAEVWDKLQRSAGDAEALNLDKKQVVLDVFQNVSNVMRMPA